MMGFVDFLGGCPAGSHLKSFKIEHCFTDDLFDSHLLLKLFQQLLETCSKMAINNEPGRTRVKLLSAGIGFRGQNLMSIDVKF